VGVTNGLALPFPELTDMADGPDAVSDLANATEDYFYDRILPAGVTRWSSFHWGSGTALPTFAAGARAGDTYEHTGLRSSMRFDGTNWRQIGAATGTDVQRQAIETNYAALLHIGFRYNEDTGRQWTWSGTAWQVQNGSIGIRVTKTDTQNVATVGAWVVLTWSAPGTTTPINTGMYAGATPTRLLAPIRGRYRATAGTNAATNLQIRYNSGGASAGGSMVAASTTAEGAFLATIADELVMNAGDHVEAMATRTTTTGGVGAVVGYVPFFTLSYIGPA
jgi:hypothetical protein